MPSSKVLRVTHAKPLWPAAPPTTCYRSDADLVGKPHPPGLEPGVAGVTQLAPAAVGHRDREILRVERGEEREIGNVLEHVEHRDHVPRLRQRRGPIQERHALGQRKVGDVGTRAPWHAGDARGLDEGAGAIADLQYRLGHTVEQSQDPAEPLIAELDRPVALVLVVGDVGLVIGDRREVHLMDHAEIVDAIVGEHGTARVLLAAHGDHLDLDLGAHGEAVIWIVERAG